MSFLEDGADICYELQAHMGVPILVLSSRENLWSVSVDTATFLDPQQVRLRAPRERAYQVRDVRRAGPYPPHPDHHS